MNLCFRGHAGRKHDELSYAETFMSHEINPSQVESPQRRFTLTAIVLLMLYPLTVGPAAGFVDRFGPNPIFTTFYRPLNWLAGQWPSFSRMLNLYIEWFRS